MEPLKKEDIIAKVKKLFDLSTSSNENEAALALAKARGILSKYNLSMADLPADEIKDAVDITTASTEVGKVLRRWVKVLLAHVATGFQCESLIQRQIGPPLVMFIGTPADSAVALQSFSFLHKELNRLADIALPQIRRELGGHGKVSLRYDYLEGATSRIGVKFRNEIQHFQETEAVTCKDLVLVKDRMIKDFMKKTFPNTIKIKNKPRHGSVDAFNRGYRDAGGVKIRPDRIVISE
jgi:hypothetical protein